MAIGANGLLSGRQIHPRYESSHVSIYVSYALREQNHPSSAHLTLSWIGAQFLGLTHTREQHIMMQIKEYPFVCFFKFTNAQATGTKGLGKAPVFHGLSSTERAMCLVNDRYVIWHTIERGQALFLGPVCLCVASSSTLISGMFIFEVGYNMRKLMAIVNAQK